MDRLPENISPEMIVAYLKKQISSDDFTIVQSWIDASSDNKQQFEQYKMVWEETGKIVPAPVDVDIDFAWNKMSSMIDNYEEKINKSTNGTGRIIPFRKYLIRIAAVIIPLVALSAIYVLLNQKPQLITKETTIKTMKDTLSDGSIVSLNKNSKIIYPKKFNEKNREVEMEGEVFFEVQPNKEKPFIIHAENTEIKVLGTSFNVKAFENSSQIEVLVKTGTVKFSSAGSNLRDTSYLILKAGETGVYDKSTNKMKKVELPANPEFQQSDKILIFNRTSLSQVIETIQKDYGVSIILKDKDLENFHYSATFKNSSVDSIIEVMSNTLDLTFIKSGTKYILKKNEQ